jgi:hypothetical protein
MFQRGFATPGRSRGGGHVQQPSRFPVRVRKTSDQVHPTSVDEAAPAGCARGHGHGRHVSARDEHELLPVVQISSGTSVTRRKADTATADRSRVNSLRRLRYAAAIGCHSADGTHLAYAPDRNLPTLLGWLRVASA